ncbi:MAG: AAA family ATPase [Defluviitaleaceae bacterium]|nr:AAA family ATPase [Defluviitaleaceae bacterium]
MAKHRNALGALGLALLVAVFAIAANSSGKAPPTEVKYIEFMALANGGRVSEVKLSDGTKLEFLLHRDDIRYITDNPRNPGLKEELLLKGITVTEHGGAGASVQTLIFIVFFAAMFWFIMRRQGGLHTAMALNPADSSHLTSFTFAQVAGNEEAKESVADLVDFLKSPDKYLSRGARMPRGALFYGPPGTGKTLLAKAVAGEAGVPFYAVSGSDFVQMYVGVGAGRIRELFKKARASEAAVIFIDEIDALGRKRGSAASGGSDERDQTLNALLTEMSGFSQGEGIIVIAATNRLDTLDEALLRPGRFDRQVEVGLPDRAARERILGLHAANKPISPDVSLPELARDTVFFSGAMLENLLNEAAIESAKSGAELIGRDVIERAYYTVLAGSEKKDRAGIQQRDREITAYHEAGHALASRLVSPEATVSRVTIIPSSKGAGGFCVNIPPDKMYRTKKDLEAQVMVSLGGRAAEEVIFGTENITTGAANDIEKANQIVRDYVMKFGMGEKSGLLCGEDKDTYAERGELLYQLYNKTKELLCENRAKLGDIADALLTRETLNAGELDKILL